MSNTPSGWSASPSFRPRAPPRPTAGNSRRSSRAGCVGVPGGRSPLGEEGGVFGGARDASPPRPYRPAFGDNPAVGAVLEQIAASLALKGDNAFRIRAFENAASAIATYPGDLAEGLRSGALPELDGVGKASLEIVP